MFVTKGNRKAATKGGRIVWHADEPTREKIKRRREEQLMAEYGLSEKSAAVLRVISWNNGLTNAEIADELDMQPRSVSGVVNGLIKKGIVSKDVRGKLSMAKDIDRSDA